MKEQRAIIRAANRQWRQDNLSGDGGDYYEWRRTVDLAQAAINQSRYERAVARKAARHNAARRAFHIAVRTPRDRVSYLVVGDRPPRRYRPLSPRTIRRQAAGAEAQAILRARRFLSAGPDRRR